MAYKDAPRMGKIRDKIQKWDKYWRINRNAYYEWVEFIMGDQWREDESRLFERYNKIPLTFNKLGALLNHLLGDQMQNTPNLQIQPAQDTDAETADIRSGLTKSIMLNSDAKSIYQKAFRQAVVGGFGAYGVGKRYVGEDSFDQELYLYEIDDPNRAYWDMSAKEKSKTDGMHSGNRTRMSRDRFRSMHGKELERKIGSSSGTEDTTLTFADDDTITIIDHYECDYKPVMIYELSNHKVVDAESLKVLEKAEIDGLEVLLYDGDPVTVLRKREVPRYKVKWVQGAGDYILEETDFESEQCPIIFVDQNSYLDKSGAQVCRSFFQDAKDAQRFLNYLGTQTAYLLKVSRYDQFMAPRSALKMPDTQQIWRDPSAQQGALIYDETTTGAKPEKLSPPEISQSLMVQYERCLMDIQSSTGMYNTQIGEMGNEVSGKAIDARTQRGSYNTYVPFNALNQAILAGGNVINQMIPKVYDTERDIIIPTETNENATTRINVADEYGADIKNDMRKGRYNIRLVPGPSYEGQKQEALESFNMVLAADKTGQIFPMIADLYAENLPLANNIQLRNRLRTIVPPEIIEAGKSGKPVQKQAKPDPMVELQKAELQLQEQAAQHDYEIRTKELQIKQAELQRKAIESHQGMTMEWEELESAKAEQAAKLQETMLKIQAEMHKTNTDAQMNHANNLVKLLTHSPKHENHNRTN